MHTPRAGGWSLRTIGLAWGPSEGGTILALKKFGRRERNDLKSNRGVPNPTSATARGRIAMTAALAECRGALLAVGIFSGVLNVLLLTSPLYMLQVYDRVLASRSVPTLVALTLLVLFLYVFQAILDLIRGRALIRIGRSLDDSLNGHVYDAIVRMPLRSNAKSAGIEPIRDLDQIRGFLSGLGPTALFDLPWMPLYLGLCFFLHFWIGIAGSIGAVILVSIAITTEIKSRHPAKEAMTRGSLRIAVAETSRRNAEVLQALGMSRRLGQRWGTLNSAYMDSQGNASDVIAGFGALSRVLRMTLQSIVLGLGGYLAIRQEASAGVIIAGSILTSRALAPIELSIAHWRGFVAARQSWGRLSELLEKLAEKQDPMPLPAPKSRIDIEAITVSPPGVNRVVLRDVSFSLEAGQALGIIGPTGSGKSSLARSLVGVWKPVRGTIRVDGAALDQWEGEALGAHIGYLPQNIELFDGTVADNISRFCEDASPTEIIAAAHAAGLHELILRLPDGYQTDVGEAGHALSAGERQRIGLARALFRDPFLVVLDEPNSNLDSEGDIALTQAIEAIRKRNAVAVVIAHRPSALNAVNLVVAIAHGRIHAFGPKDEVLQKILVKSPSPTMSVLASRTGEAEAS